MKNTNGFSTLVLVLIIGASCLVMATGATLLSFRELDMSTDSSIGKKASNVAEACISDALLRFKNDTLFSTSSQSIILDDCSCTYNTSSNGDEKTIYSNGVCQDYTISLKTKINTSNGITINSWDFQ